MYVHNASAVHKETRASFIRICTRVFFFFITYSILHKKENNSCSGRARIVLHFLNILLFPPPYIPARYTA